MYIFLPPNNKNKMTSFVLGRCPGLVICPQTPRDDWRARVLGTNTTESEARAHTGHTMALHKAASRTCAGARPPPPSLVRRARGPSSRLAAAKGSPASPWAGVRVAGVWSCVPVWAGLSLWFPRVHSEPHLQPELGRSQNSVPRHDEPVSHSASGASAGPSDPGGVPPSLLPCCCRCSWFSGRGCPLIILPSPSPLPT